MQHTKLLVLIITVLLSTVLCSYASESEMVIRVAGTKLIMQDTFIIDLRSNRPIEEQLAGGAYEKNETSLFTSFSLKEYPVVIFTESGKIKYIDVYFDKTSSTTLKLPDITLSKDKGLFDIKMYLMGHDILCRESYKDGYFHTIYGDYYIKDLYYDKDIKLASLRISVNKLLYPHNTDDLNIVLDNKVLTINDTKIHLTEEPEKALKSITYEKRESRDTKSESIYYLSDYPVYYKQMRGTPGKSKKKAYPDVVISFYRGDNTFKRTQLTLPGLTIDNTMTVEPFIQYLVKKRYNYSLTYNEDLHQYDIHIKKGHISFIAFDALKKIKTVNLSIDTLR